MNRKNRDYRIRKYKSVIVSAFLVLAMLFSLTACTAVGNTNESTDENSDKTVNSGADGEDNTEANTEESQLVSMGRYVETGIALPGNTDSYGRSMEVLSDGSFAYFEPSSGYYLSADEGENWQQKYSLEELTSGLGDYYINCSAISTEGSIAFVSVMFSEDNSASATARVVNAAGEYFTAVGLLSDGEYLMDLSWKGEELYGYTVKGNICRLYPENGELKRLFTASERPELITFQGEKMLLLENGGVEIFNLEENTLETSDEVLNSFVKEAFGGMLGTIGGSEVGLLVPDGEDAVYVAGQEGLFRHVLGGTAMEQVIDGRFSSFGNTKLGLCRLIPYKDGEFLLLTTGTELIRLTYDPNEPSRPENMLTVYSLNEMERVRQGITIFQNQNPDVWVDYQIGMPADSAITLTDALKNLNMELTAGTGPDVLILDGINEDMYIEKKTLTELGSFVDTLGTDALIPNILEASRAGEELYVIPAAFSVPILLGKTEDIENVTDMESLVQLVEKLSGSASESVTGCFSAKHDLAQLLSVYHEDFLNENQLDREALAEFLNYAARIYQANQKNIQSEFKELFSHVDRALNLGNMVDYQYIGIGELCYGQAMEMMYDLGSAETVMAEGGYSMKLFNEENAGFRPVCKLAISAGSAQPELAEDFLRTILGFEAQNTGYFDGFPINQEAFQAMCTDQDNPICFGGSWSLPDGREGEFYADYPDREITQMLEDMVAELDMSVESNSFVQEAIIESGVNALIGTITVEECINEIEKATALYLAE